MTKISKRIWQSITKVKSKGNLSAKIFIPLWTVLIILAFSMGPSTSLVSHPQSEAKVISYLHITGLQGTMQELYKMAQKELNYNMDGMNINAQVSNVNDHSVYVNFYISYDDTIIHSSSVINKNNGKYSAVAGTVESSNLQMKNGVI